MNKSVKFYRWGKKFFSCFFLCFLVFFFLYIFFYFFYYFFLDFIFYLIYNSNVSKKNNRRGASKNLTNGTTKKDKKMTYKEYKETTTQEINQFVDANCIWAFGREQLAEALKKHNLTKEEFQNNYCGFFGGGAIRKDKIKEYKKICEKQNNQLQELMKDEQFAYEALYYELANHEYGYTGNESEALRDLGLTANDVADTPTLNRAFCRAVREIKSQEL